MAEETAETEVLPRMRNEVDMMAKKKPIDIIDIRTAVKKGEIEVQVEWSYTGMNSRRVRIKLRDTQTDEVVVIKEFSEVSKWA